MRGEVVSVIADALCSKEPLGKKDIPAVRIGAAIATGQEIFKQK